MFRMAVSCTAIAMWIPLSNRMFRSVMVRRHALHGCIVKQNSLIGMNAVVMDGAIIEEESIVAAMSFVKAGFKGSARQLLVGSPAKELRKVTDQDMHWHGLNIQEYQALATRSAQSIKEVQPLTEVEANRPRLAGVTDVQPKM